MSAIRPENFDEIEAVIAILWADDDEQYYVPKLQVREECEEAILQMREDTREAQMFAERAAYDRAQKRWGHLPHPTEHPNKVICPMTGCEFMDYDEDIAAVKRSFLNHLRDHHGNRVGIHD
jgi:hypothetical protein